MPGNTLVTFNWLIWAVTEMDQIWPISSCVEDWTICLGFLCCHKKELVTSSSWILPATVESYEISFLGKVSVADKAFISHFTSDDQGKERHSLGTGRLVVFILPRWSPLLPSLFPQFSLIESLIHYLLWPLKNEKLCNFFLLRHFYYPKGCKVIDAAFSLLSIVV